MTDNVALVAKYAPSVARTVGPRWCWNSSATGGPPTDAAVPVTFPMNPALVAVTGVIGIGGVTIVASTPKSVVNPTITASASCDATWMITSPTTVPGTAPASIHGS